MAFFIYEVNVTKDEILKAIRECGRKVKRVPTLADMRKHANITTRKLYKHFVNLGQGLREAGFEPVGPGHRQTTWSLLQDWALVARKLGHVPLLVEYTQAGKYSERPFAKHFRFWKRVPEAFEEFVKTKKLQREWKDVLEMIAADRAAKPSNAAPKTISRRMRRRLRRGRKIYGEPLWMEAMAHAPTNEQGVLILFGMVALRLGFIILRAQTEYPDGEALRRVGKGQWQRVRIEFEFESRNFLLHRHRRDGCDMIVCWEHNWVDCPEEIEVVELKSAISNLQLANSKTV